MIAKVNFIPPLPSKIKTCLLAGPLRWPLWGGYSQLLLENYRFPYKAMHWMARRYRTQVSL